LVVAHLSCRYLSDIYPDDAARENVHAYEKEKSDKKKRGNKISRLLNF